MKRIVSQAVLTLICLAAAAACGDDDGGPDPGADPDAAPDVDSDVDPTACNVEPGAWSAPQFAANAVDALALRTQLDAIGTKTRGAEQEDPAHVVDEVSDLTALYEAGGPTLAATVHAGLDPVVDEAFAEFVAVIAAGVVDPIDGNDDWTPGASGGISGSGTRGLNAGGIEVRQLVDKGIFSGGFYRYALTLTEGEITPATIDALAAAWGSNATHDTTMGVRTDAANYSFAMGFHASMVAELTEAKAYAADDNCVEERDDAIRAFFRLWEESMVARAIFYANVCATDFSTAVAGDDNTRIAGLHELSEGSGLILGFRGMPAVTAGPMMGPGRVMTDAQIDTMIAAVGIDLADLNASTSGDGMEDPATFAAGVVMLEAAAMTAFGFTAEQITGFHTPPAEGG